MLRPALPRELRTGDVAYAGVVVHNATDSERWVEVTAKVDGPIELVGSPFDVKVPAQGAVEVPFRLKGLEAGPAKFTFTVSSGRDDDALEWPLTVERDALLETVASAGRFEGGRTEKIARPDGASATMGGLRVDVATTALVGAASGLEYLRGSTCDCLETRTSRALGDLMVLRVLDRVPVPVKAEELTTDLTAILGDLHRYQSSAGGLSYWPGDRYPSAIATAYVARAVGRAKEQELPGRRGAAGVERRLPAGRDRRAAAGGVGPRRSGGDRGGPGLGGAGVGPRGQRRRRAREPGVREAQGPVGVRARFAAGVDRAHHRRRSPHRRAREARSPPGRTSTPRRLGQGDRRRPVVAAVGQRRAVHRRGAGGTGTQWQG